MKVYLKTKESIKNISINEILALIPLLIYGFYKNGISLYLNHYVSFLGMLKPLIFDLLGFMIGYLVNYLYQKIKLKKSASFLETLFSSFYPIYGLLIASIISINTNLFLFIIITFIFLLVSRFLKNNKINIIALSALIIILLTNLFGNFSYLNPYETAKTLNLDALDYLLGRGSGGINTTSAFLLLFSLIILNQKETYKKEIPIYSSIIYILSIIIYNIIINNIGNILNDIFSTGILFSFVFIGTESVTSSYTSKGKFIYSLIMGLSTFGLYLIYPPLSALGGILIASMTHGTIDKLVER